MIKAYTKGVKRRAAGVFYGWWIVAIGLVIDAVKHGTFNRGFTIYFLPIQQQLGISRAALSLAESLGRLEGGLQGPVVGYMTDRFGPRSMIIVGGIFSGLGFILLSFTHSYLYFMLVFVGLLSVGFRAGYNNATLPAVNQWFRRKKSLAMSLVSTGNGLGGAAITPLLALLVFEFGWRVAALVSGVSIIVVVVPLALMVRRSPESMGLQPDGDGGSHLRAVPRASHFQGSEGQRGLLSGSVGARGGDLSSPDVEFAAQEAMRTSAYWLFVVAGGLRNSVNSGVSFHLVPLMVWAGTSQPKAALLVGLLSFATLVLNPIVGLIGDSWSKQKLSALAMLLGVLSMLVLLASDGRLWQLALFALLLAFTESANPLAWAILGDFFGRRSFATLRGWQHLPDQLMSMSTPVWMGLIFDNTGSYFWAVVPLAAMFGLSTLFYWTLPRPRLPERFGRQR